MNSIGTLFAEHDATYLALKRKDQAELAGNVLLYLFRKIRCNVLTSLIREKMDWSGRQCIDFRQKLAINGYLQCNFKFYVYARVCGSFNESNSKPIPADYEVRKDDVQWIGQHLQRETQDVQDLKSVCASTLRKGYEPRTPREFAGPVASALKELQRYAGCFYGKKLRFLEIGGSLKESEIVSEMIEFALKAMYRAYPLIDTYLHLVNIGKTAIHNRGQNIISENTTISRSRMRQEDRAFVGSVISLDFSRVDKGPLLDLNTRTGGITVCNHLTARLDGKCSDMEFVSDVNDPLDLQADVRKVFDKLGPKQKNFLRLMMGDYDQGFSDFLGRDNSVVIDLMEPEAYREKIRLYLSVEKSSVEKFVKCLRRRFAPYDSSSVSYN